MTRQTFIKELSDGLKKMGTSDIEEIIKDYEIHFDNEIEKGKTEEEISRELGKINDILLDFQIEKPSTEVIKRMSIYSVVLSDIIIYLGMLSLYLGNLSIIILSLGSFLLGIYFLLSMNYLEFIPIMEPVFGQLLGFMFISLAVLSFGTTALLFRFLNTLMKKLNSWHKVVLKGVVNRNMIYFNQSKLIKRITLWSGLIVIILFIVTYVLGVNIAENPQFWHEWNWFE